MPDLEEVISDLGKLGQVSTRRGDSLTIKIEGDVYRKLAILAGKLQGANNPGDVVRIALSLLFAAEGKTIKLEDDDTGETLIATIWR